MLQSTLIKLGFIGLIACTMLTAVLTAVSSDQMVKPDRGVIDLVSERTKAFLASPSLEAVGEVQVSFAGGTKRETQIFSALDQRGDMIMFKLTCTGTCTGNNCGVLGCSLDGDVCSECVCFGIPGCTAECECTKTDDGLPEEPPGT